MDLHIHHHFDRGELADLLTTLTGRLDAIMATLADIQAAVTAETTVEGSVIALLSTLTEDLTAALAQQDTDGATAIVADIQANIAALSAAVTANTPAGGTATVLSAAGTGVASTGATSTVASATSVAGP